VIRSAARSRSDLRRGLRAASVAAGFTVLQSCLFSLLTFTGASQFAAVGVVASGERPPARSRAATMLGTRKRPLRHPDGATTHREGRTPGARGPRHDR